MQRSPTLGPWTAIGLWHARNWTAQTNKASSVVCSQHAKPHPLWSTENPFFTEPVPGAQKFGGPHCFNAIQIVRRKTVKSRENPYFMNLLLMYQDIQLGKLCNVLLDSLMQSKVTLQVCTYCQITFRLCIMLHFIPASQYISLYQILCQQQ